MTTSVQINDLLVRCILGVDDEERRERQDVLINLNLQADLSSATTDDDFSRTLDYRALKKKVLAYVEASEFHLLETLTDRVANLCLEYPQVERVMVRIEKPSALRFARSVAIEVTKHRE